MAPAERPQPRAHEEERQRNHEGRRRRHQAEGHDAVGKGVAGGAENRERRHVGAEERQQKDHRPERAAREEEVLGLVIGRPAVAEREDADVEDDREVGEHEDRWNQRPGSLLERSFIVEMVGPGDLGQRPHEQRRGDAVCAVVREPDGKEAKHQRTSRAPEPEVLMQRVEGDDGKRERECLDRHVL